MMSTIPMAKLETRLFDSIYCRVPPEGRMFLLYGHGVGREAMITASTDQTYAVSAALSRPS